MKNINKLTVAQKQMRHQVKKDRARAFKLGKRLLLLLMIMAFALPVAVYASGTSNVNELFEVVSTAGAISTATVMGVIGNVGKVPNSQRTGKAIKHKLYILSEDQYNDAVAFPERDGVERGNIPLKAGEYWHYIETLRDSTEAKVTGEEGDFASNINSEITFNVGGMNAEVISLLENGLQEGFFLVLENCLTQEKLLLGTACKPVVFTGFEGGYMKDYTGATLTFKKSSGEVWSKYTGNTPLQEAASIAIDATSVTLTANNEYRLNKGSASAVDVDTVTAITDTDVNRIITFIGVAGVIGAVSNVPKIVDGVSFLLIGGAEWTANPGAQISFKIFKDGAASYKLVEVAGSRV